MTDEEDLLAALTAALSGVARRDVAALVDEAVTDARAEAREALRRLARQAYLQAARQLLEDTDPVPEPGPSPSDAPRMSYVFGVVHAGDAALGPALEGVEARVAVRVVAEHDLAAVVRDVDAAPFDDLAQQATDPSWLEAQVRLHDAVLRTLAGTADVVPLRFGAVFRDDERVRELLRDRGELFRADLARVGGAQEWGLRIARRGAVGDVRVPAAARDEPRGGPGPGAAWVASRRAEQARRDRARAALAACVEDVVGRLGELATDSERRRPRPVAEGGQADVAAEAAYLVPRSATGEFLDLADALADRWSQTADVQVTGPWPAYSFVGQDA